MRSFDAGFKKFLLGCERRAEARQKSPAKKLLQSSQGKVFLEVK